MVVVCGVTVRLPLTSTGPTPEITVVLAFCEIQLSTTGDPGLGLGLGFAVNDVIVGAGITGVVVTVMVTVAVVEPKLFDAVRV